MVVGDMQSSPPLSSNQFNESTIQGDASESGLPSDNTPTVTNSGAKLQENSYMHKSLQDLQRFGYIKNIL
jgi:hypothetical protein